MKLFYFESGLYCGIRKAQNYRSAKSKIAREVGSAIGVKLVREATEQDIAWVRAMGGYIPMI